MNYSNIAAILNDSIIPNEVGLETPIAEDLSNVVEFGKLVQNMTGDELLSMNGKLLVGVQNYVINRLIKENKFKILKSAIEFGGGIQRIMASDNFTAQESHLLNLVSNGQSYHDGKYYGLAASAKVYTETTTFKVVHSVAQHFEKKMFMDARALADWFGLVENTERNTIVQQINALEKRVILAQIAKAYGDGRRVQLITMFNAMCGKTGSNAYTLASLKADRDAWAYFASFAKECIARVVDYVKEPNKTYNDGSVLTYANTDSVSIIAISEFLNDIKYLANPIEFRNEGVGIDMQTVTAWQNRTTDILPEYADTCKIVLDNGTADDTVINNIVCAVFDTEGVGVCVRENVTTREEVGAEGFVNLHHHEALEHYVDTRLACVVFTLD